MSNARQILQQYWGYTEFKGSQQAIIDAVLAKQNVLAILPTGAGKSVCFQVPTLMQQGTCLVISPLIALMKDQVQQLMQKGITACALDSSLSYLQLTEVLGQAVEGAYKFLYLSPERLQSSLFQQYLSNIDVCLIAVDEAHCISQWGYDFRPAYLRIAHTLSQLKHTPVIALTASATMQVQQDIANKLLLNNCQTFTQSFVRNNLAYAALYAESKINKLVEVVNKIKGSVIVYCKNRNECKRIAEQLQQYSISAYYYHAGLSTEDRSKVQHSWFNNKFKVIVCTNAFGMGINKTDVRAVIHYHIPDCIENYYQEAGRAGRDGNKAYAITIYNQNDIEAVELLPQIKYPSFSTIKQVYQSIANYLHIPVGAGMGIYYTFDLPVFCKAFDYDILQVMGVLKALELQEHIWYSDSVMLPSKLMFTASRQVLNELEEQNSFLDNIVKCLLRNYAGVYDTLVNINERLLAKLSQTPYPALIQALQYLHAEGFVDYLPQKEVPQLLFKDNRAPADYLIFNHSLYNDRRKNYEQKIEEMLQYIKLPAAACRSSFLAYYFTQQKPQPCGICNNCLDAKKPNTNPSINTFEPIKNQIISILTANITVTVPHILMVLKPLDKELVQKVILFMQDERLINIDALGNISLAATN